MKQCFFALLMFGLLAGPAVFAQEGGSPIKVTTVIHDDGRRTDTLKDVDNRTSETKTYSKSQQLLERCVYTLDDQGRELEGVVYNAKGAVISRLNFFYDATGNLREKQEKLPNGTLRRRFVYTRDNSGRVGIQAFDGRGNPIKEESAILAPPSSFPSKSAGSKK